MEGENKRALVALRTRREEVVNWLTEQFSRDVLSMAEFEERLDQSYRATSVEALERVIGDLEPMPERSVAEQDPAHGHDEGALALEAASGDTRLTVARPGKRYAVAIMGGFERKGSWTVPEEMDVFALMGGGVLDFREVSLPPGETVIRVIAIMGGVEIIVPPTLAVDCDGIGILGGFETMERSPGMPDPERAVLRIQGFALMGGVSVTTKVPKWMKEAKKAARKALPKMRVRQLPGGDKKS